MAMKAPAHPGSIVKGCLDDLGLSVTDAAHVLDVTRPTVSKLVNGRAAISPQMAVRLSKAFGSTPEFWLRLQMNYDLSQVYRRTDTIHVERYVSVRDQSSTRQPSQ
jgi:antitoxin HigA-1